MNVVGNYVQISLNKEKNVFKFKFYPCRIRSSEILVFCRKTPTGTGNKIKHLRTQKTKKKLSLWFYSRLIFSL